MRYLLIILIVLSLITSISAAPNMKIEEFNSVPNMYWFLSMKLSSDGTHLAVFYSSNDWKGMGPGIGKPGYTVSVYNTTSRKILWTALISGTETSKPETFRFVSGNLYLSICKSIMVFDNKGKLKYKHNITFKKGEFSLDGKYFIGFQKKKLIYFNIKTGKIDRTINFKVDIDSFPRSVFSHDMKKFCIYANKQQNKGKFRKLLVYDLKTEKIISTVRISKYFSPEKISFSADNSLLIVQNRVLKGDFQRKALVVYNIKGKKGRQYSNICFPVSGNPMIRLNNNMLARVLSFDLSHGKFKYWYVRDIKFKNGKPVFKKVFQFKVDSKRKAKNRKLTKLNPIIHKNKIYFFEKDRVKILMFKPKR